MLYPGKWRTVMSTFVEQLRLAEKAAEDIYFAKVNRELIESLHHPVHAENPSFEPSSSADARTEGLSATPSLCLLLACKPSFRYFP